jgi:hypothetical protein
MSDAFIAGLPPEANAEIAAAVRRETETREAAFIRAPLLICGIPVNQLTGEHLVILEAIRSPFVIGGHADAADVALFLWILSPDFQPRECRTKRSFIKGCRRVNYLNAVSEIRSMVDDAFQDSPCGGGVSGPSFTSWLASIVDILASQYGWDEDTILRMPLARVFQYLRCIKQRNDPDAILFNQRSDAAKHAALLKLRQN